MALASKGLDCHLCAGDLTKEFAVFLQWVLEKKVLRQTIDLDIDHIIPKSKGGSNNFENLHLSHRTCNNRKSNGHKIEPKIKRIRKVWRRKGRRATYSEMMERTLEMNKTNILFNGNY